MDPKAWPPSEDYDSVIAYFPDHGWRGVTKYEHYKTKVKCWDNWHPVGLPSDGCGCCGDEDPTPILWIPEPIVTA